MQKPQISFYSVLDDLEKTSCGLIEKCYMSGKNTLVICEDEQTQELINKMLWTFKKKSFVPHGSINDANPQDQPVLISYKNENANNAELLVLFAGAYINVSNFARVFVIYLEESELQKSKAQKIAETTEKLCEKPQFYQKHADGSWVLSNRSF